MTSPAPLAEAAAYAAAYQAAPSLTLLPGGAVGAAGICRAVIGKVRFR